MFQNLSTTWIDTILNYEIIFYFLSIKYNINLNVCSKLTWIFNVILNATGKKENKIKSKDKIRLHLNVYTFVIHYSKNEVAKLKWI